jgi:glycerophosphoryl diester phosphodiesterase
VSPAKKAPATPRKPSTARAAATAADEPAAPAGTALRLAHRGDWRLAPENSLEALVFAAGTPGVDGVEFDVRLSKDGVPVLLHDETLDRVQGRHERVSALRAEALRDAGIPALADVLATLPPEAFLDVELKGDDHGKATADVLRAGRGKGPERAVISSFEGPTLAKMADLLPGWTRWLNAQDLSPGTLSMAVGLGCRAVAVLWGAITPASFKRARAAGLDVVAWTVTRPPTFDRLSRLGVVACCVEGAALGVGD